MSKNLNKIIDELMISAQSSKQQGDLSSTLNSLNEILKIDSNNKRALNNIGNVYKEMKNFYEAEKYYSKAISSDANYKIAKINLAILYHDLGNLKKAEKLYKELILIDEYNFAIYFNLSRIDFSFFDDEKLISLKIRLIIKISLITIKLLVILFWQKMPKKIKTLIKK